MLILYDIFIMLPQAQQAMNVEEKEAFALISGYISEELREHTTAMQDEEQNAHIYKPNIIVHLLDEQIRISVNGYSDRLTQKIKDTLNKADWKMMEAQLDMVWSRHNN